MFFPVKAKDGKQCSINLTQIFAFIDNGTHTIAVSMGSTTFEIPEKYETVMADLEEFLEGEDD